jgi:hypothetical protein
MSYVNFTLNRICSVLFFIINYIYFIFVYFQCTEVRFLCLYLRLVVYCFFLSHFCHYFSYFFISMEHLSSCFHIFCFLFLLVCMYILCLIMESNWTYLKIETNWTITHKPITHKLSFRSPSTSLND